MKASKSARSKEILQNASDILDVARNLAPVIPVPILSSIFITAKGIVDVSIKMHQDKREAAELAEYAATLTRVVHATIRGRENMIDKDLSLSLTQLSSSLDEIKSFMEHQAGLRFWERLCMRCEIAEKLAEYKSRLQYVMQTFMTTSGLRQELGLRYLKDGMDELKETLQSGQTFDDQFRIYRWGEIEFLQVHDLSSQGFLSDVEIYEARIEGQPKIVKVYRSQKTFEVSRRVLKLVRYATLCNEGGCSGLIWGSERPLLPFAQLEGYTSDSNTPFIVLKGGLTNMFDYLRDLGIEDYFVERLRFMIDMKHAMRFLAENGLRWKGWIEKLMINDSGRLVIGYVDDIVQRLDTDSDGGISRILISWPKLGIAEGLHVLVDRKDDILPTLYSALQSPKIEYNIDRISTLWGSYIDELNCGIASFVTVTNIHPPPLGSVGQLRPTVHGVHFYRLFSTYTGKVNVRTTGQIRPRTSKEEDGEGDYDMFNARDWRNFEGEDISMPLCLTEETGSLLSYRTSYTQLHGQAHVVEHYIRNSTINLGYELESLVVVSGVIERARATFSKTPAASPSSPSSSPKGAPPTVEGSTFFHPYPPTKRGYMRKPWGYLSDTAEMITDNDVSNEFLTTHDETSPPNNFHLTLDDFTAHTE
ncbi:hypothetical protein ACEPAF_625 [Sanghuangporus sanghuang]